MEKSQFVEDYLKNNKIVIRYVRDEYGFKKGVVVATSVTNIGWAMLHKGIDYTYTHVSPFRIPYIQYLNSKKYDLMDTVKDEVSRAGVPVDISIEDAIKFNDSIDGQIISNRGFLKVIKNDNWIYVPKFDREYVLTKAIIRSVHSKMNGDESVLDMDIEEKLNYLQQLYPKFPKDEDFEYVVKEILDTVTRVRF
jgi:hypothetical protein